MCQLNIIFWLISNALDSSFPLLSLPYIWQNVWESLYILFFCENQCSNNTSPTYVENSCSSIHSLNNKNKTNPPSKFSLAILRPTWKPALFCPQNFHCVHTSLFISSWRVLSDSACKSKRESEGSSCIFKTTKKFLGCNNGIARKALALHAVKWIFNL